jgi:hypothetical protein
MIIPRAFTQVPRGIFRVYHKRGGRPYLPAILPLSEADCKPTDSGTAFSKSPLHFGPVFAIVYLADTVWGISAVGSALHSHCRGQEFESPMLHHKRTSISFARLAVFLFYWHREEYLNTRWFISVLKEKEKLERGRKDYYGYRPHSALTYLPPAEFT